MPATAVIAIAVNPALDAAIASFRHALNHDGKAAPAYIHMLSCLTDRIVGLLILEAIEIAGVSTTQRKVVDFAVDTGSRVSAMLSAQVYKKVSNTQFLPIARDLDAMYWAAGVDNHDTSHLYYVAAPDFARRFQQVIDASLAGQGRAQIGPLLQIMDVIIDDVLDKYFLEQTRHVDIGFVTRKAMDVGVGATRAAARGVMQKVVKDFSDTQLQQFMHCYAQILKYR